MERVQRDYSKNSKASLDFEEKYKILFDKIKNMPMTTIEERKKRWEWIKSQPCYDEFIMKLIEVYSNRAYIKIKARLDPEKIYNNSKDFDIASSKQQKGDIDTVVFIETVSEAIQTYTGMDSDGNKLLFVQCLHLLYRQNAKRASGKNDICDSSGINYEVPDRNKQYIIELVKKINKDRELAKKIKQNNKMKPEKIKELLDSTLKEVRHKFTRKDIETAIYMVNGLDIVSSLSNPIDGDGELILEDTIADENDELMQLQENESFKSFLQAFMCGVDKNWNDIKAAASKADRELLKVFLTKDILITLKLYPVSDELIKNVICEPNCRQWCHKRDRCSKKDAGCYARYGEEPAGDNNVYELLSPYAKSLCRNVFDFRYLKAAIADDRNEIFEREVTCVMAESDVITFMGDKKGCLTGIDENRKLYLIYNNLLQCNFRFTDAALAKAIGASKDKISKSRSKYEAETKKMFLKLYGS